MGSSIVFNYFWGVLLSRKQKNRLFLIIGIVCNLLLLGYFKYSNFFIENINALFGLGFNEKNIILPLAISFFTFQQIAYLVDAYRNETHEYDFLQYTLFVTFFPQLIAGPIVHHKEMLPQFTVDLANRINAKNLLLGISVFCEPDGCVSCHFFAFVLEQDICNTYGVGKIYRIIITGKWAPLRSYIPWHVPVSIFFEVEIQVIVRMFLNCIASQLPDFTDQPACGTFQIVSQHGISKFGGSEWKDHPEQNDHHNEFNQGVTFWIWHMGSSGYSLQINYMY